MKIHGSTEIYNNLKLPLKFTSLFKILILTLLALATSDCGGKLESTGLQEDRFAASLSVPYDEDELRRQLATGSGNFNLFPLTSDQATTTANLECGTAGSYFASKYLGLSNSNIVLGTIIDLCSDEAPIVDITLISDGQSFSQTESVDLTPVEFLLVNGVNRRVYLFQYQIPQTAPSGFYWVTGLSAVDTNYSSAMISSDQPVYYSAPKTPGGSMINVLPKIFADLIPLTVNNQSALIAGQFCVLATGSNLTYEWSLEGQPGLLPNPGPCLIYPNVKLTDQGVYTVRVVNLLGTGSSSALLTVIEPAPAIDAPAIQGPYDVDVTEGDDLKLCVDVIVVNASSVTYTWEYATDAQPGVKIPVSPSSVTIGINGKQSCFEFSSISRSQNQWTFFFTVSNSGGQDQASFKLHVAKVIPVPAQFSVTQRGGSSDKLQFIADGDLATYWHNSGNRFAHVKVDLGQSEEIHSLNIASLRADERSYLFKIEISQDGQSYSTVYDGFENTLTTNFINFDFDNISGRYIRITAGGVAPNGTNQWTYINELQVLVAP